MRFNPLSEKEIQSLLIIPAGTYDFEVVEAIETTSKSGNEMIKLKLKIWDNEGKERFIYDYLLESMQFKLRHFCEAVKILDKYELGQFSSEDCLHKSGLVEINIQKDKTGQYPDRNAVKDYLSDKPEKKLELHNDFQDTDIPF